MATPPQPPPCEPGEADEGLARGGILSSDEVAKMMALGFEEAERLRAAEERFIADERRRAKEEETSVTGCERSHGASSGSDGEALSGRSAGLGPNGKWEVVQVVTPEVANKLVLNRGAVFQKYSYKKGALGVKGIKSKSERLVWLSGDNKIMWKEVARSATNTPVSPSSGAQRRGETAPHSIAISDVVSVSEVPPAHYGSDPETSIYLVSKSRSLLLEAPNADERDFWFQQVER